MDNTNNNNNSDEDSSKNKNDKGSGNRQTSSNTKLSQSDIETLITVHFGDLSKANVTILSHYLYKYPNKWRSDDEYFKQDVNKLMPEAFANNMRPSNVLFGAVIAIFVIFLIGLIWWVISHFINKNNRNVLNDPSIVNPAFI